MHGLHMKRKWMLFFSYLPRRELTFQHSLPDSHYYQLARRVD